MNWLICGTIPDKDFPLTYDSWHLTDNFSSQEVQKHASDDSDNTHLALESSDGKILEINRGTSALIASTLVSLSTLDNPNPTVKALLVGDTGSGEGSKKLYHKLTNQVLLKEFFDGITFHYLFPDIDWHNLVLIAIENQEELFGTPPLLVADAGFMYVAKMSGYADKYDIFTPDIGEMAFLADAHAPHPFYTRGFLLAKEHDIPDLLAHAIEHKNIAKNLIIKGETDYIVINGKIIEKVNEPSVPSMEAIGGTGDLVTGILTAKLMQKNDIEKAMLAAVQKARSIAQILDPNPATQIAEIITEIKRIQYYSSDK